MASAAMNSSFHGIAARLDRMPISGFHRKMLWLLAGITFCDSVDMAVGGPIGAVLQSTTVDGVLLTADQISAMGASFVPWMSVEQFAFFNSITMVGYLIGGLMAGALADGIGRKKAVITCGTIFTVFCFVASQAPDATFLTACRFFMGLGLGAAFPAGYSCLTEYTPPHKRGQYQAYVGLIANTGTLVASFINMIVLPMLGWRPVFIIAKPAQNIQRVAIDAKADGHFMADVFLNRALPGCSVSIDIVDAKGKTVGKSSPLSISSDRDKVDFTVKNIKTWNAEQPNLYTAVFTLKDAGGKVLHVERQKFGFRTIEYRHSYLETEAKRKETGIHIYGCKEDGLFISGQKVIVKGANRHSFRPETGRTLSKQKNIEDVLLIKSMNMNAVRLSHYPADPEFLDACDSLGLYVECEQPGWHWAHETIIGSQIVEEMVTRDVNHPSIIFWSNGNEGGFNYELEPVFSKYDPQQRVVLYPWANRNGFETKHYRSWGETAEYMRQKEIFMPTEFLHGLYDGGHGAGLKDYWKLMMSNPRCAGGFLWDLMDQGVVRTDMNGIVDCMGNFGSDGIVGPHMEKEGSFYTIREVWSPVQVLYFDSGAFTIQNCYNFTNLKDCQFSYRLLKMPAYGETDVKVIKEVKLPSPDAAPGEKARLKIERTDADVIELKAIDSNGQEIFTWSHKHWTKADNFNKPTLRKNTQQYSYTEDGDQLLVKNGQRQYTFSKKTGMLMGVSVNGKNLSFSNGPRFVAAKRADRSEDGFYNHDDKKAFQKKTQYTEYADQGSFNGFTFSDSTLVANYLHGSVNKVTWRFLGDGGVYMNVNYYFNGVIDLMGICFDYPEQLVKSKQWVGKGPYRIWQNRQEGPQYGYWQNDYNDPIPGETFEYPEFKGYFSNVDWMKLNTSEGAIGIELMTGKVGVYTPRDGRDHLLYTLPETGISILRAIPAVRNKVNTTDLNGPSAQPYWSKGKGTISAILHFE